MSPTTSIALRPEALAPYERLQNALAALAEQGQTTPCQGAAWRLWLSEDRENREAAAHRCQAACPLLQLCHQYADAQREAWGCWGGVDRTPATPRTSSTDQQQEDDTP